VNGGQPEIGQFSERRFAFLFKPGSYDVDVPVGYYTQVAGLGKSPSDVVFTSAKGVYSEEANLNPYTGALDTFWRSAENFQTDADFNWWGSSPMGMLWAVSQAAPLRRVIVTHDLYLFQYVAPWSAAGYASGGFMANSVVNGSIFSGSQQQFMTRNSKTALWSGAVRNMVFVGTEGAPSSHCGDSDNSAPITTVDSTPVIAEKPFVTIDGTGKYFLNIPAMTVNRRGVDFTDSAATVVDFENVYVANSESDSSETINAELSKGLHVVLSPGIYNLTAPLFLNTEGQVLLGLGLATLVAMNPVAAVKVGNVDGVRIAAVLLEAGDYPTEALLEWGDGTYAGNAANPGFLHDIFARVGGPLVPVSPQAKRMVRINSGNVIGDNLWLWRADHTASGTVYNSSNPCDVGLVVNGDDVTMYALAVEHTLQDLTQWNGNRGSTFFYQSELPYDVPETYGTSGYAGYRVGSSVEEHRAYGVGVYHYFRDHPVVVESAISAPAHLLESFTAPLSMLLNGQGTIQHIINSEGDATSKSTTQAAWYCEAEEEDGAVLV